MFSGKPEPKDSLYLVTDSKILHTLDTLYILSVRLIPVVEDTHLTDMRCLVLSFSDLMHSNFTLRKLYSKLGYT